MKNVHTMSLNVLPREEIYLVLEKAIGEAINAMSDEQLLSLIKAPLEDFKIEKRIAA